MYISYNPLPFLGIYSIEILAQDWLLEIDLANFQEVHESPSKKCDKYGTGTTYSAAFTSKIIENNPIFTDKRVQINSSVFTPCNIYISEKMN